MLRAVAALAGGGGGPPGEGGPPTGPAAGDLAGLYPSPQVAGLRGRQILPITPQADDVLVYDGSFWTPGQVIGGANSPTISPDPPANPLPGDLWFDSSNGNTYIYYQDPTSSQWVIAVNAGGGGGAGGGIEEAPPTGQIYGRNGQSETWQPVLSLAGNVTLSGPLGGYAAGTAAAPSFSTASGAGIYPIGASVGVSALGSNVFTFSLSANTSAVPLAMSNQRITGVGNPTAAGDAVNLGYLQGNYLPLSGAVSMTGPLSLFGTATQNQQAVSLGQVNNLIATGTAGYLPVSGATPMSGPLTLSGNVAGNLQAVPLQQLNGALGAYLPLSGASPMTGPLSLSGSATQSEQAISLGQVNSIVGNYLPLTGGQVNGNLTVTGSTGVGDLYSVGNVRANGGVFYGGGGDSYMQYDGSLWQWVINGVWLATIDSSGSLTVGNSLNAGYANIANANISNNLTVGSDIYSRNVLAFSNANWDGAYLAVGANWDYCWQFTAQSDSKLRIQQSPVAGNAIIIDGNGDLNAPGVITGNYVNANQNLSATGYVYADNLSANYNTFSATIELSTDWAWKPGGGLWLGGLVQAEDVDDEYTTGLEALLALRPVRYTRKRDLMRHGRPIARDQGSHIGLLTEAAAALLPETMVRTKMTLEGVETEDTAVDVGPLTYVLLNAVKELAARVQALEAAR